jgi:hypothetical protein
MEPYCEQEGATILLSEESGTIMSKKRMQPYIGGEKESGTILLKKKTELYS